MFGVFRVKKHDFTQINHILSNVRGARAGCAPPPPGSAPGGVVYSISPMQLVGALLMGVYPTADIWSSFYNLVFP
jgi:hypothetical protein